MDMDSLEIPNLAYWFDGCVNLTMAEIPYSTPVIGVRAFGRTNSISKSCFLKSSANDCIIDDVTSVKSELRQRSKSLSTKHNPYSAEP